MRLRTLAGRYAGEIREYAFTAGVAAVKAGLAEPVKETGIANIRALRDAATAARKTRKAARTKQ